MGNKKRSEDVRPDRGRAVREVALTVGATAGLLCIVATIAAILFGLKPLVFRSGSMAPEISTGSLALSRNVPATDLKVGDIISVTNSQGTRITHRVYEIQPPSGNTVVVTLKGDANTEPDFEPYSITEADRVFTSVGGLGYVVAWLSSPVAIFLGGAFVGALLMIVARPAKKNDDSDDEGPGTGRPLEDAASTEFAPAIESKVEPMPPANRYSTPSIRAILAISATALSVLGIAQATGTAAAFTDNATATASFSTPADMLAAPKWLGCNLVGGNGDSSGTISMRWAHLGPGYTYAIKLVNAKNSPTYSPSIPANKGDAVSINVKASEVYEIASGSQIEVRAVRNGATGTGYVGEKIWAYTLGLIKCDGAISGGNQMQVASTGGELLNARMPAAIEATTSTSITTPPASSTTASAAPSTTSQSSTATASSVSSTTNATTTTQTPGTTTPDPTESATTPSQTTTTATATADVPETMLGTAQKSRSHDYSALLVRSTETSQTAIVISDANGEELKRISATATTQYKWDSSTDTLWIVEGGKLYKASGSSWTKTSVDPSSSDVPADIAALVE